VHTAQAKLASRRSGGTLPGGNGHGGGAGAGIPPRGTEALVPEAVDS